MSRNRWTRLVLILVFALAGPVLAKTPRPEAIVGGTLVDVSDRGRSSRDIPNAVVVIVGDRIVAAGPRRSTTIPTRARVIRRPGKFIIPGLIDGFTGLQNQAEANAELYEGVTTVVGSGDDRRGHLFEHADPGPHLYAMDSAGSTDDWSLLRDQPEWRDKLADRDNPHELTPDETSAQLKATAHRGTRVIWVGWNITPDHTRAIITQSHELGLITYGEFIATPYRVGITDGVDALLHMSRYELGLAPASLLTPLKTAPYGKEARAAYREAEATAPDDPSVADYAKSIADHHVALIPTFSLFYLMLPDHRNLWSAPAARGIDPASLFQPSDPKTGEAKLPPDARALMERGTARLWALNGALMARKPLYLAASGASALGALPGVSLHVEMELLVRRGLTPREALAAATNNYSDQFGWRELGLIAPGRRADLVILDADPTTDIRNADRINDVMLSGAFLNRRSLLERRDRNSPTP